MRKILGLFTVFILMISCGDKIKSNKPIVAVSIAPLAYIIDQIADSTVDILVTVPETTSPETYELSAKQMAQIADAQFYFAIGLIDFEQQLQKKIGSVAPNTTYVNLSEGIDLLDGTCGHDHSSGDGHDHLIDPHIWLSPRLIKTMATKVTELLSQKNRDLSELYSNNLVKLIRSLDSLDASLVSKFAKLDNKSFAIVHPSLTYFARDYGLNQVSIEVDGKEPSVLKTKQVIDNLQNKGVKKILYSRQSPNAAAKQIASQIDAEIIEYDPLKRNWSDNITYLSDVLCN